MICPECKKEGKEIRGSLMTGFSVRVYVTPYYDKDGKYHGGDILTDRYECSNGHQWQAEMPENQGETHVENTIEDLVPHIKKSLENPDVKYVKVFRAKKLSAGLRAKVEIMFTAEEEKIKT